MTNIDGKAIMLARREKNFNQGELAKKIGVSRTTVVNWENGITQPDDYNQKKLAEVLGNIFDEPKAQYTADVDIQSAKPLNSENTVTLPLLASIPAGLPSYCEKDIESFTHVPRYLFPGADFIIHCSGTSMEPEIGYGAYCVIRKETQPLHNHIMLVNTEDGFTIKRVVKKNDTIELHPANDNHKIIKPKELRVIGEVIGTWKRIKPL